MFETERRLYAFLLDYAHSLVADIDDADLARIPIPGMNHPGWILGHLALAADYGVAQLDGTVTLPETWSKQFGPGSPALFDRAAYPSKDSLIQTHRDAHARLSAASETATPEVMARPHTLSLAFLKGKIDTKGELVSHLMTTHEATHIGQLSAWRRATGRPGVLTL